MKKIITFSLFLFSVTLVAQTSADDYYNPAKPKLLSKDRVSASISAGAGISFLNSKNTAYTTFIAPRIGYQLSNKFKLNIGLIHYTMTGNTFMPINQNESLFNSSDRSLSGNMVFLEGQYKLNRRVIMSGAVMTNVNNFSSRQNSFKAMSLGMDYKVSRHSTIGFKAIISQGETPYYNNPGFSNGASMYNTFGGFGQDFTRDLNNSIK